MSAYFATSDRISAAIDFDYAEAVTAVLAPGRPIDVKHLILVIKEAGNGAETITLGVRNKDDTSSTTVGTFVIPTGTTLNQVLRVDVAGVDADVVIDSAGGISQPATVTTGRVNGYQTNLPGVIEVNPGQELFLTSTGGTATTGQADVYVEFEEMGSNPSRSNPTAITFTYA